MSRDRDRILEQALKHELKGGGTPSGGCLDAETLGAWADGTLDPAAMAACEAHAANCARCQALVGTMLKSAPSAPSTAGTLGTSGTFSLWRWWLAPIAAGATAVTLWMVVPERPQLAEAPQQSQAKVEQQEQSRVAETQAVPPAAPASQLNRERSEARDNLGAAARAAQAPALDAAAPPKEEAAKFADSANPRRQDAAPPPAAAVTLQAPVAGLQKSAREASAPIEIFTLDRSRRWRVIDDRIERTDDGGTNWTLMRDLPGSGIAAGSAPSNSVAWFVGRAGVVLLTTDAGSTFRFADLAEPLDIASVSAIDAQSAIISTVNGRRFRTEDGGRTWRPF